MPAECKADAEAYARLEATESVTIDKNALAAMATMEAVVGAFASASGSVGNQYIGAGGQVRAEAQATAAFGKDDIHTQVDLGVAFFVGARVSLEVDIKPAETVKTATHAIESRTKALQM